MEMSTQLGVIFIQENKIFRILSPRPPPQLESAREEGISVNQTAPQHSSSGNDGTTITSSKEMQPLGQRSVILEEKVCAIYVKQQGRSKYYICCRVCQHSV